MPTYFVSFLNRYGFRIITCHHSQSDIESLADEYGVDQSTIYRIRAGKLWPIAR